MGHSISFCRKHSKAIEKGLYSDRDIDNYEKKHGKL